MITLRNDNSLVKIDNGELVSFTVNGVEFIHQKGNKGWRKSDDEMFPIIGPTAKNNFRVHTKKDDAIQDQHGLLRELDYQLISNNEVTAIFKKDYKANTKIKNSKFPEKSSEEFLTWPFDFSFEKHFKIENSELKIDFVILSEKEMPFMLGYHPAFLLSNTGKETFESDHKIYTLQDVYKAGSSAFPILNTDTIVLKNIDKPHLEITTKGFNNFMLWTEVDNMVCIEPITQYTSYTDQKFSEKNMSLTSIKDIFSVTIKIL
ncbi:aldose 1-epimerase [Polaribacter marinivivus]|uniref:Aldose 1-epimerase n=1 Tax=Polaribacter marinivivus TaxID=1524260 RepID=A0ABV8R678_9FLAO